jgi:hypothetical protein
VNCTKKLTQSRKTPRLKKVIGEAAGLGMCRRYFSHEDLKGHKDGVVEAFKPLAIFL